MRRYKGKFSDDEDKKESREYNLEEVMKCSGLFNRRTGKLRADWAELAGDDMVTYEMMLERGLLGPAKFVGIDRDLDVYESLCTRYGESGDNHRIIKGEIENVITRGELEGTGVLNLDSLNICRGGEFSRTLSRVWGFANRQARRLGNFALIINVALDRGATIDDFKAELAKHGYKVLDSELERPGVLYTNRRRNSRRINYCVLFGLTVAERAMEEQT